MVHQPGIIECLQDVAFLERKMAQRLTTSTASLAGQVVASAKPIIAGETAKPQQNMDTGDDPFPMDETDLEEEEALADAKLNYRNLSPPLTHSNQLTTVYPIDTRWAQC